MMSTSFLMEFLKYELEWRSAKQHSKVDSLDIWPLVFCTAI